MAFITKETFVFLAELEQNNNKSWFDENRKRYEEYVKEPFKQLVELLILGLQELDPGINVAPKQAIFRINRDIRFTKDKSPYKTWLGANIKEGGKKEAGPGFYVSLKPNKSYIGGGLYQLNRVDLQKLRETILEDPEAFRELITDKKFVNTFEEVKGEKNKRIPVEFREVGETLPIIYNKQFYYSCYIEDEVYLQEDVVTEIVNRFRHAQYIHQFFKQSLNS